MRSATVSQLTVILPGDRRTPPPPPRPGRKSPLLHGLIETTSNFGVADFSSDWADAKVVTETLPLNMKIATVLLTIVAGIGEIIAVCVPDADHALQDPLAFCLWWRSHTWARAAHYLTISMFASIKIAGSPGSSHRARCLPSLSVGALRHPAAV